MSKINWLNSSVCGVRLITAIFRWFELCVLTPSTSIALLCLLSRFILSSEFCNLGFSACILFLCSFFLLFFLTYLVVKINVTCPCLGRFTFSVFLSTKFNYIQFYTRFMVTEFLHTLIQQFNNFNDHIIKIECIKFE